MYVSMYVYVYVCVYVCVCVCVHDSRVCITVCYLKLSWLQLKIEFHTEVATL